jgi:peptide deformylase
MPILQILQYPDSRLRRKAQKVADVGSDKVKKIIDNMLETLANVEGCAGLASTQLDVDQPPRVVVINDGSEVLCLINPKVVSKEGSDIAEEACMSVFPQYISAEVKRASKIRVQTLNCQGAQIEFDADGFLARCIQHECDHLDGILYIDRLSKSNRNFVEKQMLDYCLPKRSS